MRCLLALGFLALIAPAPAPARSDDILEEGPGYFVAAVHPNAGGAVILRVDHGPYHDLTTLIDVWPPPGLAFAVTRDGGIDKPVQVQYECAQFGSKFSALYKPGKTVVDYGEIKKR